MAEQVLRSAIAFQRLCAAVLEDQRRTIERALREREADLPRRESGR